MQLRNVQAYRASTDTPLRYPGGKSRLYGLLKDQIAATGRPSETTYVEPYAGGAGAAITLLLNGDVKKIWINDYDPCIHAFWFSMLHDTESFLKLVADTPLDIIEWKKQRSIYKGQDTSDLLTLGFATFYLNRTNRSGVMNAGVIGGQEQAGKYKIDARYNRAALQARIERIASHADRIKVTKRDGAQLLNSLLGFKSYFFYIDPPYFDKGSFLYLNSFDADQHAHLSSILRSHLQGRWILTYDDVLEIRKLYGGFYQGTFSLPYSAHRNLDAKERMIVSTTVAQSSDLFD